MEDLRETVLARMKAMGWSNYRLIQELKGKRKGGKDVPPMTLYQFLGGKNEINSGDLRLIFEAIGLRVTGEPIDPKPRRSPKPKK